MSYTSAEEQIIDQQNKEKKYFRLAIVTEVAESGLPVIRLFGEETASSRTFKVIKGYSPVINDVVMLACMADTYVILGKVTDEIFTYASQADLDALSTGLAEDYAPLSHNHNTLVEVSGTTTLTLYWDESILYAGVPTSAQIGRVDYPFRRMFSQEIFLRKNSNSYPIYTDRVYYGTNYDSKYAQMLSGAFAPSTNLSLGTSTQKWSELYATSGTINTSDKKQKKSIQDIPKKYMKFFQLLKPKRFKMRKGTSDRFHVGFIAQDVEESMKECNISDKEFAGYIRMPIYDKYKDGEPDENAKVVGYEYGLRYEEFIAINTMMIQKLVKDNEELKKRVDALERKFYE